VTTSCNYLQGSANDRPLFMRTNMNPALIICPTEQQKNPSDEKGSEKLGRTTYWMRRGFCFEEISLMVFSINEGSFNF